MKTSKHEKVAAALIELYEHHRPALGDYAWEWEAHRWRELVSCVLLEGLKIDAGLSRGAAEILERLRMLAPATLADLDDGEQEQLRTILIRAGLDPDKAEQASLVLAALGREVAEKWSGHIQQLLRVQGLRMARTSSVFSRGPAWGNSPPRWLRSSGCKTPCRFRSLRARAPTSSAFVGATD